MAGMELGLPRPNIPDLKEQLVRKTLNNVRQQGHPYVDIRKDGKRHIFFCIICLSPLYSEEVLYDHLRGNSHKKKCEDAKHTLFGPNPWPFNDGMLFFNNSNAGEEKDPLASNDGRVDLLEGGGNISDLALVVHKDSVGNGSSADQNFLYHSDDDFGSGGQALSCRDSEGVLVIPDVIVKEQVSNLRVRLTGYGQISARYLLKDGVTCGVRRLWCEWLGNQGNDVAANNMIPQHDYAVVTFSYYYDLGKQGLFEDLWALMPPDAEHESVETSGKRRKSLSDLEDTGESLSNQCDSSGEDSHTSSIASTSSLLDRYSDVDQLLHSRMISSKSFRKKLRQQTRFACQRMCDLCRLKMLPGKDVATFLNLKTGRFACSTRNVHGAFHVFHVSCLLHWILLCELEMHTNDQDGKKPKRGTRSRGNLSGRGRGRGRRKQVSENKAATLNGKIYSLFCPECQGTGTYVNGDQLEDPKVTLTQMFNYKIKLINARQAYMKSPEELPNCSTGFHFPPLEEEDLEETVSAMKMLRFYQAEPHSY